MRAPAAERKVLRWYLSRVRVRVRVLRGYLGLYLGEEGAQVVLYRGWRVVKTRASGSSSSCRST